MTTTVRVPTQDRLPTGGDHGLIASLIDDGGDGVLLLSGHLDDAAPARVAEHLTELLQRGVRDITVRAGTLVETPPELIELLIRLQDDLTARHGFVRVLGLHPDRVGRASAPAGRA